MMMMTVVIWIGSEVVRNDVDVAVAKNWIERKLASDVAAVDGWCYCG